MPSARLTQARFEDLDLILADNFARAAHANEIRHVVYVGGLDPETPDTSVHLSSRMEVEQVLAKRVPCVTALRAGLVIGAGGSSYEVLEDVVRKLPVILCPSWTNRKAHWPMIGHLVHRSLQEEGPAGCHDVGASDIMTYRQLMERAAAQMSLTRSFFFLPTQQHPEFPVWPYAYSPANRIDCPLLESKPTCSPNTQFQDQLIYRPIL